MRSPGAHADALLPHVLTPDNVGCGHLKLILKHPEQYGEEVLQLWEHMRRSQIVVDESDSDATCEDPEPDAWDDAWTADIGNFLGVSSVKMVV